MPDCINSKKLTGIPAGRCDSRMRAGTRRPRSLDFGRQRQGRCQARAGGGRGVARHGEDHPYRPATRPSRAVEHAAQDCIANVTIWPFRAMQRLQRFLDNQDDDSVPSRPRTYMAKRHGFFSSSGVTSMSVARSRVHCSSVIGLSLIMYFPSTCSIC
jgi:hypothetical protein